MKKQGKIIVIVAPSGTGKSTLIKRLLKKIDVIKWSVSCTTRPKREQEVHGQDYFFMSELEFKKKIEAKEFVEWAIVHSNYYGTSQSFLKSQVDQGFFVLCDVDVQGTDSIKKIFKDDSVAIFIEPPSIEELEARLRLRGTESDEVIAERIRNAREEIKRKNDYDFVVINDDIDRAYDELENIFLKIVGDDV